MLDVKVRLRNPSIVLMPLTENEAEDISKEELLKNKLHILYKLSDSSDIEIGMLADYAIRYCPSIANVDRIEDAQTFSYFYSGGSFLEENAESIEDRPVYLVYPSDERTVVSSRVINGVDFDLEQVVDGEYEFKESNKKTMQFIKKRY